MQSHRLYALTNPQQRAGRNTCTTRICPHMNLKIPTIKSTKTFQTLPPHPTTCPSKYRINNVSSPAQAREKKKGHAALARNHTSQTTLRTHKNKHAAGRTPNKSLCTTRIGSHMNPKTPSNTFYKTISSSPLPENKHAKVSHQERLGTNARTPSAEVSRSIKTQQHRLNGLSPQQRARLHADDQQKTLHDPDLFSNKPKHSNNQISSRHSNISPHSKTCTPTYRIENVSSPPQARHHAALTRNHTASTA